MESNEHIPVIIDNNTNISDWTQAILDNGGRLAGTDIIGEKRYRALSDFLANFW